MSTINDGGPAFPPHWDPKTHPSGMTLRNYFAAMALQGAMAGGSIRSGTTNAEIATAAYGLADAMLAARKGYS